LDSKLFAEKIADLIFNKKGYDVRIIDLRSLTTFSDFFVICSADSDTQVKAIADEIDKSLRDEGIKCWHKEGYMALSWVLLDYVDVVVHVFKKDAREFYNIEKLWGDAPIVEVVDPELRKKSAKPKAKTTTKAKTKTATKSAAKTTRKKTTK
jgi:ribosome-associated protein